MSTSSAHLSVVIPFYNEFENAAPLFERLLPVLNSVAKSWEVICVDDGSDDDTLNALIEARQTEPRIRILKLSRNFGKEAAVSAGLQAVSGQQILLMDGDLQHPPETLTEMLEIQDRGIDVVYGLRKSRKTEGRLRSALSSAFYSMFSGASDVRIPADAGDFRLMSRRVVDALNDLPEQKRFIKGLYAWVGFSQQAVLYDVEARRSGKSKWSISQLFGYAWNGVMSFSAAPLRMWSVIGICIAALAVAYAVWVIATTLIFGRDVPGYATLVVAIFFLGGLQLLSIGVLGEYIARIFAETKQRPLFIIEEKRGFDSDADE
ncbi:MAG: glycosyltransferase family 2 protein [Henriciella sp.]|nr:glycosyltransferase family 2 protein [Henriciella sp.]MBO6694926.1 glycosyltransferase family 2 protein [Henriciella sp.]